MREEPPRFWLRLPWSAIVQATVTVAAVIGTAATLRDGQITLAQRQTAIEASIKEWSAFHEAHPPLEGHQQIADKVTEVLARLGQLNATVASAIATDSSTTVAMRSDIERLRNQVWELQQRVSIIEGRLGPTRKGAAAGLLPVPPPPAWALQANGHKEATP